jgi:CelD/BcsL family acetyltransferase involved in cellulose biosynthesis
MKWRDRHKVVGDGVARRASTDIRLVLHRTIPEDSEFRRQWNDLVMLMESPEVFYTWEWARAVSHAYGARVQLMAFAAYRGDEMIGVAALKFDTDGYLSFLANTTADYCDFVSHPDDRQQFLRLLLSEIRKMNLPRLRLANVPADSASIAGIKSAVKDCSFSLFLRPAYMCAQIILDSESARLSTANSAKRRLKKLLAVGSKFGELTVRLTHSWDEFAPEFLAYVKAHVARFSEMNQSSNLIQPERQVFLAELAKLLSEKGWLAVSTLKLNSETIAWNYGFIFACKWFYYQPTFVNGLERLSPGTCLLSEIIAAAAADPRIRMVDLGLGDEDYKRRYTLSGCQTVEMTAHSSRVELQRIAFRYHAAQFVKKSPRLEKIVRVCRKRPATANLGPPVQA